MTPRERYEQQLNREDFVDDAAQRAVAASLEDLQARLIAAGEHNGRGVRAWLDWLRGASATPVRGLYLWGGVGSGKTMLMDFFYESLPFERRLRMHFHRFMNRVHSDLRCWAGESNPLEHVAAGLAADATVICFDELFVSDITDAMLLGELFDGLFRRGVCLVATSNVKPRDLYRDGLQRRRFLPAIDLLEQHTEVLRLDTGADYRLRALERAALYHWPLDAAAEASLELSFERLAPETPRPNELLAIENREIRARFVADKVAWFAFRELCMGPRSQNDYIELARCFQAILLSGVPSFGPRNEDAARRFISLVDELYDRGVKLIVSAAEPIESLYQGSGLGFEFERTRSRLLEMQSQAYLARDHVP